ncbi:PAP2-domain-containing protein [Trichodelitschia bisporula]|uniref:PAP2-domain-containing protein n=1 Tax=Trichodelitschia bisporula TaxID=703511 RepID=A0A6G1HSC1_9PEZI|nr:PAP2-domain-containing protein [Trichodelitschia bisporula]
MAPGIRRASMARESGGIVNSLRSFWRRSYASDVLVLLLLLLAYLGVQIYIEPFHRMFFLSNLAIQYPHAEIERVPLPWLFAYALGLPLAVIALWGLLARPDLHKIRVAVLGLLISLVLAGFVTDIIKNAVGRPRPDLIARCKPAKGTPAHSLVTVDVCTETNHHTLHDGWRSFPSGHSSFAFAGLGFLSLLLTGQFRVLRPRAELAPALLSFAPLLGAALIAISRCEDYRHDVWDVSAGSALGLAIALFSYRRYFPALSGTRCDEPYPVGGGEERRKVLDEEEGGFGEGEDGEMERIPLTQVRVA